MSAVFLARATSEAYSKGGRLGSAAWGLDIGAPPLVSGLRG